MCCSLSAGALARPGECPKHSAPCQQSGESVPGLPSWPGRGGRVSKCPHTTGPRRRPWWPCRRPGTTAPPVDPPPRLVAPGGPGSSPGPACLLWPRGSRDPWRVSTTATAPAGLASVYHGHGARRPGECRPRPRAPPAWRVSTTATAPAGLASVYHGHGPRRPGDVAAVDTRAGLDPGRNAWDTPPAGVDPCRGNQAPPSRPAEKRAQKHVYSRQRAFVRLCKT